jgi:hypothetical protein
MINWALVWDILDKIGIFAAVASIFISLSIRTYLWRKEKRDNALIDIRLHCPDPETTITLQGQIRRKNLTRAEVQGLLGILPMKAKGQRYQLQALNQAAFFDKLEDAQINGKVHELIVECTPEELGQFDLRSLI